MSGLLIHKNSKSQKLGGAKPIRHRFSRQLILLPTIRSIVLSSELVDYLYLAMLGV